MPMRPMKGPLLTPDLQPRCKLPKLALPKLDGIRGLTSFNDHRDGTIATSASGLPLASKYVQKLAAQLPVGLDGEWVYGEPNAPTAYNLTQSAVNSIEWPKHLVPGELRYYVFDRLAFGKDYVDRLGMLSQLQLPSWCVKMHSHCRLLNTWEAVHNYYAEALAYGFEGLILRSLKGMYKEGRATPNEDTFWKLKPFDSETHEARIIGWTPLFRNGVESEITPLGLSKKPKLAEHRVYVPLLGSFQVVDLKTGVEFSIGGGKGMTDVFRHELHELGKQGKLEGLIVRYTKLAHGELDAPRSPQFRGFRDATDLTSY